MIAYMARDCCDELRQKQAMSWIDLPPVWLLTAIAAAWGVSRLEPEGLSFGISTGMLGWLLIGAGAGLTLWAVQRMQRLKTPLMPRREPQALVTDGPFRFSRNPIYLGDVLILLGVVLLLDSPLALLLVPSFMALLVRRFIAPEEAALAKQFPSAFAEWSRRTRRWF